MNIHICNNTGAIADKAIEASGPVPRMGEVIELEQNEEITDLIVFDVIYTLETNHLTPNVWCNPPRRQQHPRGQRQGEHKPLIA